MKKTENAQIVEVRYLAENQELVNHRPSPEIIILTNPSFWLRVGSWLLFFCSYNTKLDLKCLSFSIIFV